MIELRHNVSVLVECNGRTYRVIDNLRQLVGGGDSVSRNVSEQVVGKKVLDLAREVEVGHEPETERKPR